MPIGVVSDSVVRGYQCVDTRVNQVDFCPCRLDNLSPVFPNSLQLVDLHA